MECRIIRTQFTAVCVVTEFRLLFYKSGRIIFPDPYGKNIFLSGNHNIGNIKVPACKSACDQSEILSVEVHFRFPVYSVEVEEQPLPRRRSGSNKLVTVPEIGIEI